MTIISSGALALQNAGTDPSESVDNVLHTVDWTAGVDGLLQITQLNEIGDGNFQDATVWQGDAYGYNNNMFSTLYVHGVFALSSGAGIGNRRYQSVSNFGSFSVGPYNLYSDNSGTSRVISGVFWGLPDASPNNVRLFIFGINGTGVPNSDNTFSKLEITTNGGTTVTINRSDLSYDSSENGDTFWYWSGSSGTMYTNVGNLGTPSSSSYNLKIISGSTSTTRKNGIAEEFGGDDSSNVKISDYYKNGGSAVPPFVSSSVTASIPTSGQIKFSDFYGATDVPAVTSAVEVQPAAKYQVISGPRGGQYEHILHGLGASYLETHQTSYSSISSSTNNDSAQGSAVGSPNLGAFGVSSTIGTLRAMLHGTIGPSGSTGQVILIVGQTGSNSNAGFTTLTITRSGMTTLTLTRANADDYNYYSADGGTRLWRWVASPYGSSSDVNNYRSGTPASSNVDSLIFPGGSGSGSANTTTTSRSTWTIT